MKQTPCNDCGTPIDESASYCHVCFCTDPHRTRRRRENRILSVVLAVITVLVMLVAGLAILVLPAALRDIAAR